MIKYDGIEYYSFKEVAEIFNIKHESSVTSHIRRKAALKEGYRIILDKRYMIKSFIDDIISYRKKSVDLKETAKLINKSKDTTLDILHSGKLPYFFDKWNNIIRVYKSDIEEFLKFKEGYSVEALSNIFGISKTNIQKKIRLNYSNVNKYKRVSSSNGFYVEKEFINYLEHLRSITMDIKEVEICRGIKKKDIIKICKGLGEDSIHKDFITGEFRVNIKYLDIICQIYKDDEISISSKIVELKKALISIVMCEEKLKTFYLNEYGNVIDKYIVNIKNEIFINKEIVDSVIDRINSYYKNGKELNLYEDNNEVFNLEELNKNFGSAIVTMARKIRSGQYDKFVVPNNRRILIKKSYLDYLRKCKFTSVHIGRISDIGRILMNENKINNILEIDLFSQDVMIKNEYLDLIKTRFNYIYDRYEVVQGIQFIEHKLEYEFPNLKLKSLIRKSLNIKREKSTKIKKIKKYKRVKTTLKEIKAQLNEIDDILKELEEKQREVIVNKKMIDEYIKLESVIDKFRIKESTFFKILRKEKIDLNNNIKIIRGKKYIKKSSKKYVEKILHEAKEDYLNDLKKQYEDKIILKYILEKHTINRKKLEIFMRQNYNIELDHEIKSYKGIQFLKRRFIERYEEDIELYFKDEEVDINSLISWGVVSDKYGVSYDLFSRITRQKFNIEAKKENYYIYNELYLDKNLAMDVISTILKRSTRSDNIKNYTNIKILSKEIGYSEINLKKIVSEYNDKGLYCNEGYYIENNFANEIKEVLNETIEISYITKQYKIPKRLIVKVCETEDIELINDFLNRSKLRIHKNKIREVINSDIIVKWDKNRNDINIKLTTKNEIDYYNGIINMLETKQHLKITNNLFNKFATERISNTNGKVSRKYVVAKKCYTTIEFINRYLDKEIFYCKDDEILNLVCRAPFGVEGKILRGFIKWCNDNFNCNFSSSFTYNESQNANKDNVNDIYSKEEWRKITKHLVNIDNHILKAISSHKYSCLWLLSILHLLTVWRINDLVTKIPNIDIEILNIDDFEWFKDGNEFKLSMGQEIFKNVEMKLVGVNADKNNQELRIFNSIDLTVPISIAYIIAEIHRRKNNNEKIFSILLSELYGDEISPWVALNGFKTLFENTGLPRFSNLKANRTLMTYMYEVANETEGTHSISYVLCGAMRSHKVNSDVHLPISTQIYLKPIINTESTKAVSYNLLKRGFFGWMPYKLLQIAYDESEEFKDLNIDEVTYNIVRLRNEYGLVGMEELAKYINVEQEKKSQNKVFNELLKLDKNELKIRIRKLLTGESSSKHKHCGCLKGNICAYPNRETCVCCEYFVKNIYFLAYVNEEINKVINNIFNLNQEQQLELVKWKKILFDLLTIITEAREFYYKYDSNFVDTFIDFKNIKSKMKIIKHKLICN